MKVTFDVKWVVLAGLIFMASAAIGQAIVGGGGGGKPVPKPLPAQMVVGVDMNQKAQDLMSITADSNNLTADEQASADIKQKYEQIAYHQVKGRMMDAAVAISVSGDIDKVQAADDCLEPLAPTTTTDTLPQFGGSTSSGSSSTTSSVSSIECDVGMSLCQGVCCPDGMCGKNLGCKV